MIRFTCVLMLGFCWFLSGCTFISWETEKTPMRTIRLSDSLKPRVAITGFAFSYQGALGTSVTNVSAYNYKSGALATGTGYTTHYGTVTVSTIKEIIQYSMESQGINVRSRNPQLILHGQLLDTGIDFSHFWSDFGINFGGAVTLGCTGSIRRKGSVMVSVYNQEGELLKRYTGDGSYNYKGIGTFFSTLGDSSYRREYAQFGASTTAAIACISAFLIDLERGRFDSTLKREEGTVLTVPSSSLSQPEQATDNPEKGKL